METLWGLLIVPYIFIDGFMLLTYGMPLFRAPVPRFAFLLVPVCFLTSFFSVIIDLKIYYSPNWARRSSVSAGLSLTVPMINSTS